MKLGEDDTVRFVEMYREYECLWNKACRDYKDRNKRRSAEEEMVKNFQRDGFGVNELKQKIKNIRCTYNQEVLKVKKSKKSGTSPDDLYTPTLKWFAVMDDMMKDAKVMNDEEIIDTFQDASQDPGGSQASEQQRSLQENSQSEAGQQQEAPVIITDPSPKTVARRSNKRLNALTEAVQEMPKVHNSLSKNEGFDTDNDNDAFGMFVASSLKKLPPRESILAQGEIQQILQRYRLNAIHPPTTPGWNSSPSHSTYSPSTTSDDFIVLQPTTDSAPANNPLQI